MYTVHRHVRILISLLKEYKVKHLVLSPGYRNVPFVHSVEDDPDFICYSVVDERSAAFFALGIAKETGEPVAISCTSSTACSNYLPAVKQAYEEGIPLIVLTADRNPYYREQMENQMIMQPGMYGKYCRKAVDLPTVKNDTDAAYCERLVNEALLELDHNGRGPVQINFCMWTGFFDYPEETLPKCRVITRVTQDDTTGWGKYAKQLRESDKVMLLFGEGSGYSQEYIDKISSFFARYNCFISVEHMSNIHCDGALRTFMITESISDYELTQIMPDIIITFGANFASDIKNTLRRFRNKFRHWRVSPAGDVVDMFMNLDTIFQCSDEEFFDHMLALADDKCHNSMNFYNMWKNKIDVVQFPDLKFSNFYAIGRLAKAIPENSILHLSILNSIRLTQFFDIKPSVTVYANLGAYGIDGSMSTFLAQARNTGQPAYLIVGDLSFLYDMNSMMIDKITDNVKIMVVNNHGGGEFHYTYHTAHLKDIDRHVAAGHNKSIKSYANAIGIDYISAKNREELETAIEKFTVNDKPVILEVFTNIEDDAGTLTEFKRINKHVPEPTFSQKVKRKIKKILKK